MLTDIRERVCAANLELPARGLVTYTWGNASEIDRASGLVVIKASGVDYSHMRPEHMVIVRLEDGAIVEGDLRPSSDLPTHLALYRAFPEIGGVVHTHSTWATSWAQAGRDIPCYGTTHADYFFGPVPAVPVLTEDEIESAYEINTGLSIVRAFGERKMDPMAVPACLCSYHGPFTWGKDVHEAVHNAVVLEEVAQMAMRTEILAPGRAPAPDYLQKKHYLRKHGPNAYYGQR